MTLPLAARLSACSIFLLLGACTGPGTGTDGTVALSSACQSLEADVDKITAFVQGGCYKLTGATRGPWVLEASRSGTPGLDAAHAHIDSHHDSSVYRSASMHLWSEAQVGAGGFHAATAIPDDAAIVVEVHENDQEGAAVEEILSMVWSGEEWFFYVWHPGAESSPLHILGALEHPRCVGCHVMGGDHETFIGVSEPTHSGEGRAAGNEEGGGGGGGGSGAGGGGTATKAPDSNNGETSFAPVYQRLVTPDPLPAGASAGAKVPALMSPLAEDSTAATAFVKFFNHHASTIPETPPSKTALSPHAFPRAVQVGATTGQFATSDTCASCHGTSQPFTAPTATTDGSYPWMAFTSESSNSQATAGIEDASFVANWSMYGEYTASIMSLSAKDPIWHAQVEAEVLAMDRLNAPGTTTLTDAVQDVCFSCHAPLGQKQLATSTESDKSYDFQRFNANDVYGHLGGDGVGCEVCHTMGPSSGTAGQWDGADYGVFYGPDTEQDGTTPIQYYGGSAADIQHRQEPEGFPFPFTSNYEYNHSQIVAPDEKGVTNGSGYMGSFGGLAEAKNMATGESYLRDGAICGACHVVIVPKVPADYSASMTVGAAKAAHPNYHPPNYPDATRCADTVSFTGNPLTDPCLGLSYEQVTYFEWLASEFGPGQSTTQTCQDCHMLPAPTSGSVIEATAVSMFGPLGDKDLHLRRHQLLGINMFVHQMYQQFPELLGVNYPSMPADQWGLIDQSAAVKPLSAANPEYTAAYPDFVRDNLLNAETTILDQAVAASTSGWQGIPPGKSGGSAQAHVWDAAISGSNLEVEVRVENLTGHKFPSGAGFRRAWIRLEVKDAANNVLWVSGQPNLWGALCNGQCGDGSVIDDAALTELIKPANAAAWATYADDVLGSEFTTDPAMIQPHYQTITGQDQVQIYEVREVDEDGVLAGRLFSLFESAKDNRIQPKGSLVRYLDHSSGHAECASSMPAAIKNGDRGGLNLCSLAKIVSPHSDAVLQDADYTSNAGTGMDTVTYRIPTSELSGTPARVYATLYYQAIPPYFLRARFVSGCPSGNCEPAADRALYMTSHLNLDLGLSASSSSSQNALPQGMGSHQMDDFDLMDNTWSMTLSKTSHDVR